MKSKNTKAADSPGRSITTARKSQIEQRFDWRPLGVGFCTLVACLALIVFLVQGYQRESDQHQRADLSQLLSQVSANFSLALSGPLASVEVLASAVQADPKFATENFEALATSVAGKLPEIISLQLAPDGVVRYLTDLERNRAVIGHDLFADPQRNRAALLARKSRKIVSEGPISLLQGGSGLIIRRPIFLAAVTASDDNFWGFATVVVSADRLFSKALDQIPSHVKVALRSISADQPPNRLLYGDPSVFSHLYVATSVKVGDDTWQLALGHPPGVHWRDSRWQMAFFALAALAAGLLAYVASLSAKKIIRNISERAHLLQLSARAEADAAESQKARRLTEEELAKSEASYRLFVDNASDFITLWNIDGTASFDSPSVERLLGKAYQANREIGSDVHLSDRDEVCFAFYKVVDMGGVADIRYRMLHEDGITHWYQCYFTAISNSQGEIKQVLASSRNITESMLVQKRLREESERLDTLLHVAPQLRYFVTNSERSRWFYLSLSMIDYWGLEQGNFSDADFTKLDRQAVSKNDLSAYLDRNKKEAAGDRTELFYRINHPKLGVRWTRTRTLPVRQADNSLLIYGVSEDVTERELVRLEVYSAQQRLNVSLAASDSFVIETDQRLQTLYISQSAIQLLGGFERDNLKNIRIQDLLAEREVRGMRVIRALELCLKDGLVVHGLAITCRHVDGSELPYVLNATPLLTESGEILGLRAVFTNVFKLRAAEQESRERGAMFVKILEHSQDFITVIDRHGRLAYRGRKGRERFPKNKTLEDSLKFVSDEDRERVRILIDDLFKEGGTRRMQYRLRTIDNDELFMDAIASAIPNEQGGIANVLTVSRDVTEIVRANERQGQSQKLEAIGQLAGGLAHDFNNLLGIVIGNLDDMEELLPQDANLRRRQRMAMEAAQRGAQITRSLMTVARRHTLSMSTGDLNAYIDGMLPLLRASIGATFAIQFEHDEPSLLIPFDGNAISNVLINLVINARDACRELPGRQKIVVRTRRQQILKANDLEVDPGEYAVLEVIDNGIGMTAKVKERAFESFFTTKKAGEGTGLGLSAVYAYAREMNGTAVIESTPGRGATVSVFLPFALRDMPQKQHDLTASEKKSLPEDTVLKAEENQPQNSQTSARAQRVLVVDDEEGLCELGCAWMEALGFSAAGAKNADQALEMLAAQPFDVLFTDIVMPGSMNGVGLARRVKELYPEIPIILTSGNAGVLTSQGVDLPGILVEKPYRKADLSDALRQVGVNPPKASP